MRKISLPLLILLCSLSLECTSKSDDKDDADDEAPSTGEETETGNTAAVVTAANSFLASLSSTEKATAQIDLTTANAESWSNIPVGMASRNGLMLENLTSSQRDLAVAVAAAALSEKGAKMFADLRAADDKLSETNRENWGSNKYYIAFLGTPSTTDAWMLQIGGHHQAYNITYNGTTSGTPLFVGVEPLKWTASGTTYTPMETQRAAVDALAQSVLGTSGVNLPGSYTDVVMGPNGTGAHDTNYPQSYPTTNRGLAVSSLTADQKVLVKTVIESIVNLMPTEIAEPLLAEYESDTAMASTYVGLGLTSSNTVDFGANPSGLSSERSYLRVDGPRVWFEFVVQQGAADHSNVHYHALWRDKTADYGAELK